MGKEEIPKKNNSNDLEADFQILDDFTRFDQKNDVFRRAWWDDSIKSKKTKLFYATYREPLKTWRKADGYTQKDYALRNAAWHVSDLLTEINKDDDRREGFSDAFTLQTPVADTQIDMGTEQQASDEIKKIALEFGAGLVGITNYDNRWEYSRKFSDMSATSRPAEIPDTLNNVIVIAQPMDYELVRTVPSALSGSATGLGYSHDALVVLSLTQYIRNLGWEAVGSMNDTALVIPYAIVELMRIYAWTTIIDNAGLLNGLLEWLGLIDRPIQFKRFPGTVFLVIVYTYVLFMVFPIYNVMNTLDKNQIEAARDGAVQLWPEAPGNISFDWIVGDKAAVETAFAGAERDAWNGRQDITQGEQVLLLDGLVADDGDRLRHVQQRPHIFGREGQRSSSQDGEWKPQDD